MLLFFFILKASTKNAVATGRAELFRWCVTGIGIFKKKKATRSHETGQETLGHSRFSSLGLLLTAPGLKKKKKNETGVRELIPT